MADQNNSESTSSGLKDNSPCSSPKQDPEQAPKENVDDPELDELLDSALEDFDKPAPAPTQDDPSAQDAAVGAGPILGNPDEMFSEVFDAAFGGDEGSKQLEDMLKNFLDPETLQNIEKIATAAGSTDDSAEGKQQFEDTIKQTLGGLAENAEKLQSDMPDDDLFRMMTSMNLGAEGGGLGGGPDGDLDFMPMMQTMMKSLISKEVLYPSLKEIADKYPTWLAENESTTDPEDLARYKKQHEFMKSICDEFDKETPSDTEEMKKKRFDQILDMMQNMQELGYPPKDLTGDMPGIPGMGAGFPGMDLDENGMPKMPANPEQCNIM